jgi:hypothetical protein
MQQSESKIALLIDADNAPAAKIEAIISEIAKYGVANVRRACDDSQRQLLKQSDGGFSNSQMRFLASQAGQPLCLHKQQTTVQPSVLVH